MKGLITLSEDKPTQKKTIFLMFHLLKSTLKPNITQNTGPCLDKHIL